MPRDRPERVSHADRDLGVPRETIAATPVNGYGLDFAAAAADTGGEMEDRQKLFGMTLYGLRDTVAGLGLRPFHASQMARWLYAKGVEEIAAMTDLPAAVRSRMAGSFAVGRTEPLKEAVSKDGTRKYLFPSEAGQPFEVALIPERGRATVCLSTQAGCRRGCRFCATGRIGFHGNLSAGEILHPYAWLRSRFDITNLVFMGMGEPLDNLDAVLDSLAVLTEPWGYALSPTRITVSTVGILPALERLLRESRCHVALSLHSPFDAERKELMPVEASHPLTEVLRVLREARIRGQRRVMIEIILFHAWNTSPAHARALIRRLDGLRCRVNLIPFNAVPGTGLEGASREEAEAFQRLLLARGLRTTIRASRGADIEAACGLLRAATPGTDGPDDALPGDPTARLNAR